MHIVMATTEYSHAFLVGNFNRTVKPKQLEKDKRWGRIIVSQRWPVDKG